MGFVSNENHTGSLLMNSLQFVEDFFVLGGTKPDAGFCICRAKGVKSLPSVYGAVLLFKELGMLVASLAASIHRHNPLVLCSKMLPSQLIPSLHCCKGFSIPSAGLRICPFQIP